MFQYICEKMENKVGGWQTRFLTQVGKETLIKAVAFEMSIYSMNFLNYQ